MTPSQNRQMLHSRLAGLAALLLMTCSAALAQTPADKPLNFDDLARTGLNPTSSFRAQGVAHQVNELVNGLGNSHNAERDARRSSSSSSSSSTSSSPSKSDGAAWKILKQYEGGFAEFGMGTRHTIVVIRCRSGAEHKLYRDGKGKWGSVGLGGNNSAPSFEVAAGQKCN